MAPPPPDAGRADRLLAALSGYGSAVVALSGGVDSALVACAARRALGDRAAAATADSPSVPRAELEQARQLAASWGLRHVVVATAEFDAPDYVRNAGDRCYHCKGELYARLERLRADLGFAVVASGANLDDNGDYRPGLLAAAERGVRHPLQEAGFRKSDVRELARAWGLPVWDKPAAPCLSSRLAPGVEVTPERTGRVEMAELALRDLGVSGGRVRLHPGELARVEVGPDDLARLAAPGVREALAARLRSLGFRFVTLDLEGFRSGSLNELVPLELKARFAPTPAPPP